MKKCLLTLCSILLLAGCTTPNTSSVPSSEVIITEWDMDDYYAIYQVMDPNFIPYLYSDEVEVAAKIDDQSNILYVQIDFIGGFNPSTVTDEYVYLLESNNFIVDSSAGYGYKEYSLTEDGVVQYGLVQDQDGTLKFELLCYYYVDRYEAWPQEYFDLIFEYDIPKYESVTYQYAMAYDRSTYNGYYIDISCNKVEENSQEEYKQILSDAGYVIENMGQDIYLAKHEKKEMTIMFYYNAFDQDLFLRVYSHSSWPVTDVKVHVGEVLPKYNGIVSFVSYMEVGEEPNTSEVLCIYFDGVEDIALDEYKAQLLDSGWSLVEDEEYILEKMVGEKYHSIQLAYGTVSGVNSFCIAIY